MNFKSALFLMLSFSLFFSCKTPKETDDLSTLVKEMEMQKNPCFGKCPAYTLTIYKGGIASFDGRKFVKNLGLYTKKLTKSEYKDLKKAFKKANLWSFDDDYPSNIPDLPKTRLSISKKGKQKSVIGDINRPQAVKDLQKRMESLADSDGWNVRSVPELNLPDYYITDQLVVGLKKSVDVKEWIKQYSEYEMKVKSNISPNRNLWLLKYDDSNLKPSQVMNLLSMDEDVLVLEFNKKVDVRED